jgi:cytochrome c biogenesis protein CcmG/thiol:disulfide interchange protein DsbE
MRLVSRGAGLPFVAALRRLLSPIPLIVIVGVLALIGLLAYGVASNGGKESNSVVGKAAPTPTLSKLEGSGKSSLAAYKGKVVVLNYWASWCEPCRKEAPLLESWQKRLQAKGGTVLGIDVLDVSDDARAFIRRYKLSYPTLRDGDGSSQAALGILAYPESFVIDRQGKIAAARRGVVDDAFMRDSVLPLLNRGPS